MNKMVFAVVFVTTLLVSCQSQSVETDTGSNPIYRVIDTHGEEIFLVKYSLCVPEPSGDNFLVSCFESGEYRPSYAISVIEFEKVENEQDR